MKYDYLKCDKQGSEIIIGDYFPVEFLDIPNQLENRKEKDNDLRKYIADTINHDFIKSMAKAIADEIIIKKVLSSVAKMPHKWKNKEEYKRSHKKLRNLIKRKK